MGREEGFYWVRLQHGWIVAYWNDGIAGAWYSHGTPSELEGILEINPTRLVRPDEVR